MVTLEAFISLLGLESETPPEIGGICITSQASVSKAPSWHIWTQRSSLAHAQVIDLVH